MNRAIECMCGQRLEFPCTQFEVACPECGREWGAMPTMFLTGVDEIICAKNIPPRAQEPLISDEDYQATIAILKEEYGNQ